MKICSHCSSTFDPYHKNSQKYCSKICQRSGWRGPRRTWNRQCDRKCESCSQQFKPRQESSRFCSRQCLYNWLSGPTSPSWKGGRVVRSDGYIYIVAKDHPNKTHDGYVLEHRLVMEQSLGRFLTDKETVHHINGDRADNRIENLQLRTGRHGRGSIHQCADCGSNNIVSVEIG